MATLKKYDLAAKEIGKEDLADTLLEDKTKQQTIKDYIVAICANARQWSANTKGRSEVNKVKQKSQQQKGLGRARHSALSAPQFKGGGVVFGPKPKFDQHVKINKKQKNASIRSLIIQRIKENKVHILDISKLKEPKTKTLFAFFKNLKIENNRVLIVGNRSQEFTNVIKSIRNIPKKHYSDISKVNGYQLALSQELVFLTSTLDDLNSILSTKGANNE